ncbi:signal peptidase I [Cohnella cholangitidis]|uniref:Signal peptidase I n=1 Tax=Cohnella cholangitidis TaxID=2598458 RepID=A0A7G5BWS4_9BACL|nr:signal peptidase I [Cohnella cholangitidis]QMV41408.1 signal peptidase I [Cohnella cholangitidis]
MSQPLEPATSSGGGRRRSVQKEKKPILTGWRKELWDWSKALIVAVAIVLLLKAFVFQLSTVKKISMEPTLHENEWLFINKIVLKIGNLDRGDVVILKDPTEGSEGKEYLVKRIVGIPGDTVEIREGELYINGDLKVESYTDVKIEGEDFPLTTVSAGHYFVLGDNRHASASRDSRAFKEVPEELIKGRADLIIWPISRWAKL